LQAVIGDDAADGAEADGEVGLLEFLGDDVGGGVRIQEEVAQDLADGLFGAAVVGLGAGFLGLEGQSAALLEGGAQLVVALAAIAEELGDSRGVRFQAFAVDEHEEAWGEEVAWGHNQGAGGAGELVLVGVEAEERVRIHGGRVAEGEASV
jgi:hypothetical protein